MNFNLYLAPKLAPRESLYSWLQRLSQSQGFTYEHTLNLCEITYALDIDSSRVKIRKRIKDKIFGARLEYLELIESISRSVNRYKSARKQILTNKQGHPVTKICSYCLGNDVIPYLRIEWRFKFWRFCPEHLIELKSRCPYCDSEIELTERKLESTPNFRFCSKCYFDFSNASLQIQDLQTISEAINLQKNMMASLVVGYCKIAPISNRLGLHNMFRFDRLGILVSADRSDFEEFFDPSQRDALLRFLIITNRKLSRLERTHDGIKKWKFRKFRRHLPHYEKYPELYENLT